MDAFLNSLEKKFGRFTIHGLTNKLLILKGVVVALTLFNGGRFIADSINNKVISDLITVCLYPPRFMGKGFDFLWLFFAFYIFYLCGNSLEKLWGSFRFNLFVFSYFVIAFCFSQITGIRALPDDFLYLSTFMAFAIFFPNVEFLIFFVLPVKVKWLGIISAIAYLLFNVISFSYPFVHTPPLPIAEIESRVLLYKILSVLMMLNVLSIFLYRYFSVAKHKQRAKSFQKKVEVPKGQAFHTCSECGITDIDDPELEFRVSAEDGRDYCEKHWK